MPNSPRSTSVKQSQKVLTMPALGLIGLTLKEAYNQHCWGAAVLVGVAPRDGSDRTSGIVGDPNRIILEDDHVMFIALHPTPTVSDTGRER